MPSRERNDSTMGIEAPQPIITGGLPHSVSKRPRSGAEGGSARIEADGGRSTFAGVGGARVSRQMLLPRSGASLR